MKTFKPSKISVLWKTFEHQQKIGATVVLLMLVDLDEPGVFHGEQELWKMAAAELGKDVILDECMPKQRGELLVHGSCYAPGGLPQQGGMVRVQMGSVDKTLYVFGDRTWEWHGAMSYPAPFTVMPIDWSHAFGGEGFEHNPLGKGAAPAQKGEPVPLPNVEDPRCLLKARGDRPIPASFAPYELVWPQRWSKLGTYDIAWLKTLAPGFAADIDLSMFNAAAPDQQIEGFWRGDEAFVLENMHPTRPRLEGRLPGVRGRCFITRAGASELEELPLRLDTVRFFPHRGRVLLAFRGLTGVEEDDASDIVDLLAAAEDLGEARPLEHYREVRALRLEKRRGALHALRDGDLVPARAVTRRKDSALDPRSPEALVEQEGLLRRNIEERMRREAEQIRASIAASGGDPAAYPIPELPKLGAEPSPDLEDLASFVERAEARAEAERRASEAARAEANLKAREAYAAVGVDYDAASAGAKQATGGPPSFSADKEMERLRDIQTLARNGGVETPQLDAALADPTLRERLDNAEAQLKDTYRKYGHLMPPAATLDPEARAELRRRVSEGYASGQSFVGQDLTGADLSGLDLAYGNFQGALLEGADLRGARLTEVDFTGAVLARADLSDADLSKARLGGANLGAATLRGTRMGEGVDLTAAVLSRADLAGADLRRARMRQVDLLEAKLNGADLRGAEIPEALFVRAELAQVRLGGADLSHACFVEVDLTGADITSGNLSGTTFVNVKADGIGLVDATFENARIVGESTLVGADLRGARLSRTNLRGVKLTGADLSGATANQADLSSADLNGARLYHLVARGALFIRTDLRGADLTGADLFEAIVQKAKLDGANFKGASLFRADLFRARGDARTSFERANVKGVRFLARKEGP